MSSALTHDDLLECGMTTDEGTGVLELVNGILRRPSHPHAKWSFLSSNVLRPSMPFAFHRLLYKKCYEGAGCSKAAWIPSDVQKQCSNVAEVCRDAGLGDKFDEFLTWSTSSREEFWSKSLQRLGIKFSVPPQRYIDVSSPRGAAEPVYLPGAQMNIADSCFQADEHSVAIVFNSPQGHLARWSVGHLKRVSCRVAEALTRAGLKVGDAVAIDMPMTAQSVAIYLGIVMAGMVVVSIADSFSAKEIKVRIDAANTKFMFTQDVIVRGKRELPLYSRVLDADAPACVVLAGKGDEVCVPLREGDVHWDVFLRGTTGSFQSVQSSSQHPTNILFSSGTTGTPKAIPWSATTPLKVGVDSHFHHDIYPGEVVCWPTNIGWMMGPWLIYSSLLNKATIALFYGTPTGRDFCEFVSSARVNMLGVIPSIVQIWKRDNTCRDLDWSHVRRFSSTGEASSPILYLWLMARAGYKPVIEYCGGTEIGGAYITGSMMQPQVPAQFSTPSAGLGLVLLDEQGGVVEKGEGEVALCPPSLGLSTHLLNRDHYKTYFEDMPTLPQGILRRHGDHMQRMVHDDGSVYYRALGRVDDTMNLGGIKVSSVELETACQLVDGAVECACIAVSPEEGGPSQLVVFCVLRPNAAAKMSTPEELGSLRKQMQSHVSARINPLFRVSSVLVVDSLPRTASGKVMRRVLRSEYMHGQYSSQTR